VATVHAPASNAPYHFTVARVMSTSCGSSMTPIVACSGRFLVLSGLSKRTHLIMLDLNIPRMDGYAVMERLGRISTPIMLSLGLPRGRNKRWPLEHERLFRSQRTFRLSFKQYVES